MNTLERQFEVDTPARVCLTAIMNNRLSVTGNGYHLNQTDEGWLSLSMVIALYSRRVVGGSAQARKTAALVVQAWPTTLWQRKFKAQVLIHTDQASQFRSRA